MRAREFIIGLALLAALSAPAGNVRLAATPALTPDGSTLVFEWQEDLWTVPVAGGQARALTRHPALDRFPVVSPDGKSVAFMSNRDSTYQTWIIPLESGEARQVTRHSEGSGPQDWFPDGRRLIVRGARDSGDFLASRFFAVDVDDAKAERQLFDEPGEWARVSPDGGRILYMHGGDSVYRRGYRGSLAATIWLHDLAANTFTNAARSADGAECRWPLWRPDGKGFYFVREDASRASNLWEKDLATGEERQRTFLAPPGVFFPGISRDGSTLVFRSGFDFYRWSPADPAEPSLIQITAPPDSAPAATSRLTLTRADNHDTPGSVSFTPEGDEVLFTTGGDLWVMDTDLREPVAITRGSDAQDAWAFFAPGASNTVYFLRDTGDRCNLWKAERADPALPWWRNGAFTLTALTDDTRGRTRMSSDPAGTRIAWIERPGSLWIGTPGSNDAVRVFASPDMGGYSWSPDGKWLVCSAEDSDDNHDVWIVSADGAHPPVNISRHPDWDGNPEWSPDGRFIAWVARRFDGTYPIQYARLYSEDRGRTRRDLEPTPPVKTDKTEKSDKPEKKDVAVRIDFDGLADDVQTINLGGGAPAGLFWSWDGKALAFRSNREGKDGTWKIFFPHPAADKAEFMSATFGEWADWTAKGIRWSVGGVPALYERRLPFTVRIERDESAWRRLALRKIWRTMRDEFYDAKLNRLDWNAVLATYDEVAGQIDESAFSRLVSMMFGELNASHLGYNPKKDDGGVPGWRRETGHLGVTLDPAFAGPGLLVRAVVAGSPADRDISRLVPGDVITHVGNTPVSPGDDLCPLLEGPLPRDVVLRLRRGTADLSVRLPLSTTDAVRELARKAEIDAARAKVHEWSHGRAGYIQIAAMRNDDLRLFEKQVYDEGEGRDGLVIDVRNNRGGFTADQILSILIYPQHAVTIPRGGQPGYQGSYLKRPRWNKPVTVLCNEHTASNGEIFSHAIKSTGRGKLVGKTTQGGVISTSERDILDLGTFRVPHRGWFSLPHGIDMERQGAEPDVAVENPPGSRAAGFDPQLYAGVNVLLEEIQAAERKERLTYASGLELPAQPDDSSAPEAPSPPPGPSPE